MPKGIPKNGINNGRFKKGDTFWLGKKRPEIRGWLYPAYIKSLKKVKKRVSETNKNAIGDKAKNWKGGITPINNKIRGSLEYKLWSDSVWNRDNNCCQKCGENRLRNLVAHHIKNFAQFLELRFAIDNGITFCRNCHKEFHKKYGNKNNTQEQLKEFLEYGK